MYLRSSTFVPGPPAALMPLSLASTLRVLFLGLSLKLTTTTMDSQPVFKHTTLVCCRSTLSFL
jgi:hypothetical protein